MTNLLRINLSKVSVVIAFYMFILIGAGFWYGFEKSFIQDLYNISIAPSVLITDFFVVGSVGISLVNAGLVGLSGIVITKLCQVNIRGPVIAAVFTMAGFSFLGKTIINIWPIILGVFLYSKYMKDTFTHYLLNALFGTALAPIVTSTAVALELGIIGGILTGIIAGFLVPPLAGHLLSAHQGLNLYNIGFTAGFIGTLFTGIFRGFGYDKELVLIWGEGYTSTVLPFFLVYIASMTLVGLIYSRGSFSSFFKIHKMSGALVSDFVEQRGFGATFINMGAVGIWGIIYLLLIGAEINGPSLAGIFTMIGFGAFGKHSKNILPIMLGAYISLLLFKWHPTEPGPVLGVLFGTTLSPISGTYGPLLGIITGGLHISMVMNVGYLHGGLNLYNNGFAGGIVATIMAGLIKNLERGD
ncbi:DUF1576 domain-containing protein [Natranaerofaba carboxydovora]|uniref:DUF1576 domain-containing protein n=1 Tax=Natranaerofaba carboxydovora TaxID=2742683 RepID=UPI001F13F1E6|nr:DUF1576 domain-containing protein [Natranaerofaba carboxydovora]UMZ74451.1 hypothetical protein ACONDI_02043 [Natranaerofaba carboxydovora]